MSFFEFPHTRTYDSDLGWLIKSMKELLDEYNDLIAWRDQHDIDYRALLSRVTALERNIITFEAEMNRRFSGIELVKYSLRYMSAFPSGKITFPSPIGISISEKLSRLSLVFRLYGVLSSLLTSHAG